MKKGGKKTMRAEYAPVPKHLLRAEEVAKICLVKRQTLYRWIAERKFPRGTKISGGRVGWEVEEVNEWLAARKRK